MDFHLIKISPDDLYWLPQDTRKLCALPYPDHPKGCPNHGSCQYVGDYLEHTLSHLTSLHIAWVEFDLEAHAQALKPRHPNWTERQCRNLLYWQSSLRKHLRLKVIENLGCGLEIIHNAEGEGINYYRTMRDFGITLDLPKNLKTVRIIALVINRQKQLGDFE